MNDVPADRRRRAPHDAVLLDVREDDEWTAGHAPEARHVPMSQLTGRLDEVPAADPLYVICRSGSRSARVVAFLSQQGVPAVNVAGGMQCWAAAGRPMVAERAGATPGRRLGARGGALPALRPSGRGQRILPLLRALPRPARLGRHPARVACPAAADASGPLRRAAPLPVHPALGVPGAAVDAARPTEAPPRDALTATRATLASLVPALWATATVAAVAAGAELWRYVLLLASRSDALPAGLVAASDALVTSAATVAPILTVLAGALLVVWSVRASRAAGEFAGGGARPFDARDRRGLAAARGQPVGARVGARRDRARRAGPPGRAAAAAVGAAAARGGCCGWRTSPAVVVVALWSLRTSVQAQADGVVLHAVLDLLAAVTAGVTAVLVVRLTRLLTPSRGTHREVLVAVR